MLYPSPLRPRQPKESSCPCRAMARQSRWRDLLPHLSGQRVLSEILPTWVLLLLQHRRHLHRTACIVCHANVMEFQQMNFGSTCFLHTVWDVLFLVLPQPMAWLHVLQGSVHRGKSEVEQTFVQATGQSNQVPKGSASYHSKSIIN